MMADTTKPTRAPTRLPAITAAQALSARDAVVIDLRSPSEFALDHVPGAHNVPLFGDAERALIGTLYRKTSPAAAFEAGRRIARAHVQGLVRDIAELVGWKLEPSDLEASVLAMTANGIDGLAARVVCTPTAHVPRSAVVLHCWRGGLRSQSVAALLHNLGLERAVVLQGGYKAYRAHVVRELDAHALPPFFVLRGLTGVGKTLALRELERMHPRWTLDLEELAQHRSSLLGMVGLEPCSQKMFESRLVARLRRGSPGFLVVEGESRKVGDIILRAGLWHALEHGVNLELVADDDRRVEVLVNDYLRDEKSRTELMHQLPKIDERMVRKLGAESLASMLARGAVDELVRLLLERYYDPLYRHSQREKPYAARFDAADPARAASEIGAWIERHREAALERAS
jgi:tRNA 2-selenouridine synthase